MKKEEWMEIWEKVFDENKRELEDATITEEEMVSIVDMISSFTGWMVRK